jgi:hypothetical protein
MNDFSFIRLEPSLELGRNTRPASVTSIFYNTQIQLSPNEFYCQISNVKDGISFDGNYSVYVVDCNGKELRNITDRIALSEFTYNGLPQIKFEIAPIGFDFYKQVVILRFKHTVSDAVYYSNPLIISDYEINLTTRFNYQNFTGPEAIAKVMQSIRLNCWFDTNDAESEITEYTQIDGLKVSGRAVITEIEKYKFERMDNFTFRRLNKLLTSNVVYINGYRFTNKQVLSSGERIGNTNVWKQEFTIPINYNDTLNDIPQIWDAFAIVDYLPINTNTSDSVGSEISVTFNRDITASNTAEIRLYKDGNLIETYNLFTITDNIVTVNLDALTNGNYRLEIEGFESIFGETLPLFFWLFSVEDGEFDSDDFNNDFLID